MPKADTSLVEACLDNVSIAKADGASMTEKDCIGTASGPCMEQPGGLSTAGMVGCTNQEYDFWDGLLNESYQALMAAGEGWDPESVPGGAPDIAPQTLLRQMQRDWIAHRDSVCMWGSRPWDGGTIVQLSYSGCMLDEVANQALRLRAMQHFDEEMR